MRIGLFAGKPTDKRNYGEFSQRMAHTDSGIQGNSLSLDVPQGMDSGTELVAGNAREAGERVCQGNGISLKKFGQ